MIVFLLFVLLCLPVQAAPRVPADKIDATLQSRKAVLLDVREKDELVESGTLPRALHIPLGQLESRLGELPKDRTILVA